jgi:hypothetical protein
MAGVAELAKASANGTASHTADFLDKREPLSSAPPGLADGLALKELRYGCMQPIRPNNLVPPYRAAPGRRTEFGKAYKVSENVAERSAGARRVLVVEVSRERVGRPWSYSVGVGLGGRRRTR